MISTVPSLAVSAVYMASHLPTSLVTTSAHTAQQIVQLEVFVPLMALIIRWLIHLIELEDY
jgi:hypothetical protein